MSKWYKNCQDIIKPILLKINLDNKQVKKYFHDEYIEIWKKCFTHKSKDDKDNYERVEFLGDELLDFVFSLYLYRNYENVFNEKEMTELKRFYMSKHKQPAMTKKFKINKLLIYNSDMPSDIINYDKICTDLYESFYFTIFTISELIEKNSGLDVVYKLMMYNFKDIKINKEEGKGHSKNRVNQTFQMITSSSKNTDEITINKNGIYNTKIYVPERSKQILIEYNIALPDLLGEGEDKNKNNATLKAYDNALETLLEYDIDKDKIIHVKSLILLDKLKNRSLVNKFKRKMNEEDYVSFQMEDQKLENQEEEQALTLFYLYGLRRDGTKKRLAFLCSESLGKQEDTLDELIKKYLEK